MTVPNDPIQPPPPPALDAAPASSAAPPPTLPAGAVAPLPPQRYTRRGRIPPLVWPLLALGLILVILWFSAAPGHRIGSLIDVADNAAPIVLIALGMTLVIATGGIDLSVGAIMALAGTVAALLIRDWNWPVPAAVAAALGAGALAGAWNGFLVAVLRIQPLVATLVLMVAGRGIAQLLSDGQQVNVTNEAFDFIGTGKIFDLPFAIYVFVVTLLAIALLSRRTAIGLFIESVGDNPTAARYAGVNEVMVKFSVYVVSGLCAAMAGAIAASDIRQSDANSIGLYRELDAILAVVIGGTALSGGRFSLIGSVIGALIVQAVTGTILTRGVKPEATQVVKAIVVVVVALLQSPRFISMISSTFGGARRRAGAGAAAAGGAS